MSNYYLPMTANKSWKIYRHKKDIKLEYISLSEVQSTQNQKRCNLGFIQLIKKLNISLLESVLHNNIKVHVVSAY